MIGGGGCTLPSQSQNSKCQDRLKFQLEGGGVFWASQLATSSQIVSHILRMWRLTTNCLSTMYCGTHHMFLPDHHIHPDNVGDTCHPVHLVAITNCVCKTKTKTNCTYKTTQHSNRMASTPGRGLGYLYPTSFRYPILFSWIPYPPVWTDRYL